VECQKTEEGFQSDVIAGKSVNRKLSELAIPQTDTPVTLLGAGYNETSPSIAPLTTTITTSAAVDFSPISMMWLGQPAQH